MLLDPKIVAEFWLAKWDDHRTKREKELNSWVDDLLMTAMWNDAEYSFAIVEAIHDADKDQKQIEVFAAGPVEDLLANHGRAVIERIEKKAKSDVTFAQVLGGVWQNQMPDEIWDRVKAARDSSIWSDTRK